VAIGRKGRRSERVRSRPVLLGGHVSSGGGIFKAVDRGVELGCDAIQIFSQSPRMWKATDHGAEALERFRERRAEEEIDVVIHAPYLINLASEDDDLVEKSTTALVASLEVAGKIDAIGAVVHVGSHLGSGFDACLEQVGERLKPILDTLPDGVWLLLENTAGAGGTIGRSLDELQLLVERGDHPRLGLCLDSCHLYASGTDVADPDEMDRLVRQVQRQIGLDRLKALHVNDSLTALGSNRDRHAELGKDGLIGDGLATFLGHPKLQGLPALLETGVEPPSVRELRRLWRRGVRAAAERQAA
jgi:deoxyribonuclease-4